MELALRWMPFSSFGLENINREEIFDIEVESKKNGIWIGLGIGIAMDAFFIFVLAYDGT